MPTDRSQFDSEQRLNSLIERWAGQNRLTATQTETIRQNIAASSVLPFKWWWNFFKNIGLVERGGESDSKRTFLVNPSFVTPRQNMALSQSRASGGSTDFIPYLRLTGSPG